MCIAAMLANLVCDWYFVYPPSTRHYACCHHQCPCLCQLESYALCVCRELICLPAILGLQILDDLHMSHGISASCFLSVDAVGENLLWTLVAMLKPTDLTVVQLALLFLLYSRIQKHIGLQTSGQQWISF